jgi:Ca2+-transporting ATPase
MKPYNMTVEQVYETFGHVEGISQTEADTRREEYGDNVLKEAEKKTMGARIVEKLRDPMTIVLVAAAILSGCMGEIADTIIIFIVVAVNIALGIMQENKAEEAIAALQKMSAANSKVKRDGVVQLIPSSHIVPGDLVLFEAGDAIPADLRIVNAASLKIEEAALTGESVPSDKNIDTLPESDKAIPLGDRDNMAYMGTSVVYGRGAGVVIDTGMKTEMGKIADALASHKEEETPLQKKMEQLSKTLTWVVLAICVTIFVVAMARGNMGVFDIFMTAVSLAVAAIPEGLVLVVTFMLSTGVKNMAEQRSIIRRLNAVETLGCASIICSDKTGTLTQNKMTVVEHFGDTEKLKSVMQNCNDATTETGDPTEVALKIFGNASKEISRAGEAPFDSDRKLMSTVHRLEDGRFIQYTKGAPDELLRICTSVDVYNDSDEALAMSEEFRSMIHAENKHMADRALRVLGGAIKYYEDEPTEYNPAALEHGMQFVGLCGMIDPVRPEVKDAINECKSAGIRPIMITGDHRDTAFAIAKELGITEEADEVITGTELTELGEKYYVGDYSVYARVQPEHKVQIVNAWRSLGCVTAMTGDGVNDAPAIKSADIGVGMGITGTDVTKNVADMVLADDNFATIVRAVREGRRIYENIRKSILYLMSTNAGEVLSVFVATILGFTLIRPIHILWINLVTDTFPALALGNEPAEADSMMKPPRKISEGLFDGGAGWASIAQGIFITIIALVCYCIGGITMAFVGLSTCEAIHALNIRSRLHSLFTVKKQNMFLWMSVVFSTLLTIALVYVPGLNTVFELEPLSGNNLAIAMLLAITIIPAAEAIKGVQRMVHRM